MTNKTYDILKFVAQIVLPAAGTLYFALAGIWGFPYGEQIVGTIAAVDAFLGAILGISSAQYYKEGKDVLGTLTVDPEEETANFNFNDANINDLIDSGIAKVKIDVYEGKHEAE